MTEGNGQGVDRAVALVGTPPGDDGTGQDASAGGKRDLTVLSLGQLLARQERPKVPLLGEWLRDGESVLLWAPTGAGKSLFALSVALAVAGGGRFLEWQGTKPPEGHDGEGWRVLYVDGEMTVGDTQERAEVLLGALPGVDRRLALDGVQFLARMAQDNEGEFLSITSDRGLRPLLGLVDEGRFNLVVLDNLSTLGDIVDENSAGEFINLQRMLLALKRRGVAVILVHHADKSGTNYRGSSRLPATIDVVLGLGVDKNKSVGEVRFKLLWTKVRARGKDLRASDVRLVTDADNDHKAQWIIDDGNSKLETMKAMLASGKYSSQAELAQYFGHEDRQIRKDFANGVRQGLWGKGWAQKCLDAVKAGKPVPRDWLETERHDDSEF